MLNVDASRLRAHSALLRLAESDAAGGVVLMAVAALALLVANSPLSAGYFAIFEVSLLGMSIRHWINDGLMALFFLLVGLEIKREVLDGQLSTWRGRALPAIAALGGMAVPAAIYVAFTAGDPQALRGWAIPAATDIAFALGVLALVGARAPVSLKIFLTALAILDDLGAVAIIALFYTADLSLPMLGTALAALAVLAGLNRRGVAALWPYLLIGAAIWAFVLKSGVHASLAGVAVALTIPLRPTSRRRETGEAPLHRLEHALAPWVNFAIVPVFGFANAGVDVLGLDAATLVQPVPLGVALGLFLGKQAGVLAFAWAAIRLRLAALPAHAGWIQLHGVSLLCGIGFTMSLFIGALAFPESPALAVQTKIGVLIGSGLSALAGFLVLRLAAAPRGRV